MGLSLGSLVYSISMNNSKLKADVDESKRKIRSMNKEVKKQKDTFEKSYGQINDIIKTTGFALTAFAGFVGVAGFKLANFAGRAEDTQQKFGVVFQGMESQANSFVKNFSDKFDIADSSIQEWMATLKDTFDPLGVANKQSLEWSKTLTALALDVETFYPGINSVNDAIGRFTSYLVGNHEAVREMGVVVNEAMIKTKAYEMGIADAGSELTELQKMTARYELLLNGLENAQGNATRELDNFNMALTQLKEVGKETAEVYGEDVKPTFATIMNVIKEVLKFFRDLPSPIRKSLAQLTLFGGVFAGVSGTALLLIGYLPQIVAGIKLMSTAMAGASLSFTPFMIGGAIIIGLLKVLEAIKEIKKEAKLAMKDVSKVTNLQEAKEQLDAVNKEIERINNQNEDSILGKELAEQVHPSTEKLKELENQRIKLQEKIKNLQEESENKDDDSSSTLTPAATPETSYYDKELAKLQKEMDMQGVALEEQISKYQEIKSKLESAKRQLTSDDVPKEFKKKITAELEMSSDDIDSALSETEVKLYQLREQQATEYYNNVMQKDKEHLKYKEANINTVLEEYERMYNKIENDDRLSLDTRKQLMEQYSSEIKRLEYQRDAEISNLDQQLLDNQKQLIDDGLNVKLMSLNAEEKAIKEAYKNQIKDQNKLKEKLQEVSDIYNQLRENAVKDYDKKHTTYDELDSLSKLFYQITGNIKSAQSAATNFTNNLEDGLTNAIVQGKSLTDVFKNLLKQIEAMVVKQGIVQPIVSGIGSFVGSMFTAHTGGYIAADGIDTFHVGGVVGLKPDERLVKTRIGELILNKDQQGNLASNMNQSQQSQPTTANIFNITAMDSQDVIRALTKNDALSTAFAMDMSKNGKTRQVIKQYNK